MLFNVNQYSRCFKVFSKQFADVAWMKVTKIHTMVSGSKANVKSHSVIDIKTFRCIKCQSKSVEALGKAVNWVDYVYSIEYYPCCQT